MSYSSSRSLAFRCARLCAPLLVLFTVLMLSYQGRAAGLPAGFAETVVAGGLSAPTAMALAPDGRIFVTQQGGSLRVIKNGALLATPFVTVSTTSSGERGLLGVAFDPDFVNNHYVYIYYTVPTAPIHNRISRFTANGDVAAAGSEFVLMDLDNLSSATNHNGGAIHFGPDGKLYVAVGENANPANAQSINTRLGKLLRINSDGTIPSDNPTSIPGIAGTPTGLNRAIWSAGLRNPYTFAFQPGTGRMFINDVGQSTWEEINDGIIGSNYAWNVCEGFCSPPNPTYRDPLFEYGHGSGTSTGCAITGGVFYNPANNQFPASYVGKYFYGDYCSGWIRRFDPVTATSQDFATGISAPLDMFVGGDGSLYYLSNGAGTVMRVRYTVQSIYGHITYADDPNLGARNVTVSITAPGGFVTRTAMTDVNGDYTFTELPLGNSYTVTPTKTGGVNNITAADAIKVGRFAAGLDIPTANQAIAADVDGDGLVTSYDASYISRYVNLLGGTANVGTWAFLPANRTYPNFSNTQPNQNFTAVLKGDVDGNWSPARPGNEENVVSAFLSGNAAYDSTQLAGLGAATDRPSEPPADARVTYSGTSPNSPLAISVSLPNAMGQHGLTVSIPISVGDMTGQGVRSYDLQVSFDPTVLQPTGQPFTSLGTLSAGMIIAANANNSGHIVISAYQANDLAGAGTLINLNFNVVGTAGQSTSLSFVDYNDPNNIFHPGFRFDAGNPAATTTNGSFSAKGPSPTPTFTPTATPTSTATPVDCTTTMYASTTSGNYISININTAASTMVGTLPTGATTA